MKISLVITALNEIEGSRMLFDKIPWSAVEEAVVVDGNSRDGTDVFYESRGIRVVHQHAPGLGESVLTARRAVTGDAMIFFHPDGNCDPDDVPKFRTFLEQGYDLVLASRMLPGALNEEDDQIVRLRKWANMGFALIANVCWRRTGPYVHDMMNGFRAMTCDAFDRMNLDVRGCAIDYQAVIRALKASMRIYQFPTREGKRISGETKFKSIPSGLSNLKVAWDELSLGKGFAHR